VLLRTIQQVLALHINRHCPKTYHRPDNSVRIVEYHRKLLLLLLLLSINPKPSPRLEPMTVFGDCGLCSCNIPAETYNFGVGTVLLSSLVSELQTSSSALEPRNSIFVVEAFVTVVSYLKQTALILAPFFYRARFPTCRNRPRRNSNSRQFSGVLFFLYFLPVSRNKHAKFGTSQWIRSRAIREHVRTHAHAHTYSQFQFYEKMNTIANGVCKIRKSYLHGNRVLLDKLS
jgi:hypothetical protein